MNASIWLTCLCLLLFGCLSSSPVIEEEASPSWAPDSQSLVYQCYLDGPTERIAESNQHHYLKAEICTIDIQRQRRLRLTTDPGQDQPLLWSPNGSQIVYIRDDDLYLIDADGSNQRRVMAATSIGHLSWSPQGNHLLFNARFENANEDIFLLDVRDGHSMNLTQSNDTRDIAPMWAFDGTKIVYLSANAPWYESTPMRLQAMNTDGSNQQVIYDQAIFYNFIAVVENEQIVFTTFDLTSDGLEYLYTLHFGDDEPVSHSEGGRWSDYALSSDGRYFLYQDTINFQWKLLDTQVNQITGLPISSDIGYIESAIWSPDNNYIALTVTKNPSGFYEEHHIAVYDVHQNLIYPLNQR